MANDDVRVSGLDELYRQLQDLPAKIELNVMRGATRAGQNVIAAEVRRLVPEKTGALKKSIRVRFMRRSVKYGWVRSQVVAGNKEAWYAHILEFGSGAYYAGKGGKSKRAPYEIFPKKKGGSLLIGGLFAPSVMHPGVKPTAFMRRAFDAKRQEAVEAVAAYARQRIPKEMAKR